MNNNAKSKKWTVWVLCSAPWRPDVWVYNKEYTDAQLKARTHDLQDYDLCDDCGLTQDECNNDAPTYPICFQHKNALSSDFRKISSEPELRNLITNAKSITYSYFYANPDMDTDKFVEYWLKNWNSKHRC